ncbi:MULTISPECIES: FUSC family protein [unclassified Streptomyces]|uniref:FUSC family protein n=1 Tax=unclassified Streptomyces TaxID=2593676 RepID=UPI00225003B2|nr:MULTISPECIES: FUSC family protein [unclassified Streptomyces]WSP58945.1 FUSC family protein [Streptomyces sp. NBC_01241]WSU20536.1 FUSC family protein [Streptomyces sp. NBC_01108]MCX4790676.1 FUSC family protein [Streptomyces sp. NBC_01221]WSJ35022.1 FUSC family protein [Streptomyces sp. NBC_01321]WSP61463.1 FUSC family protein [Streptomyces sp. NBC_01240]
MSDTTIRSRRASVRRLPLAAPLRLARPSDMWFKPALSVVVATAVPDLVLFAMDRLDLVMYTMAGSLCALYGHNLPYARRARAVAGVVVSMVIGLAISLVAASLTGSTAVLIAVGALLAAGQKVLCDATRIGPPGPLIFTFITSAALFAPQHLGQVPGHLALTLAAGAVSWLVAVGPAAIRREGPERRATARALDAAAAYVTAPGHRTRHAAVAAVHAAWQALLAAGRPTPVRRALERLVVHAEAVLAGGVLGDFPGGPLSAAAPTTAVDPDRLRAWAGQTRARGPVPTAPTAPGAAEQLFGTEAERAARRTEGRRDARRTLLRSLAPGSPLLPIGARALIGCALAGYVSQAAGVGRPYWAIVTAASLYQANVTLTWNRALQRTLGNLLGVLVFAAVLPVSRTGPLALIGFCLLFGFAAEALITRNYWLGSIAVTPMALLVLEFGGTQPAGELIGDRVLDTVIGAAVGLLAAVLVTNRRATGHLEKALTATDRARAHAVHALAAPQPTPAALDAARRRLTGSLVELREAHDTAAGEWWQRARPQEQVLAAEQAGHRTLAATAKRQGLIAPAQENGAV